VCAAARVDSQRFRAGYLTADERRKLSQSLHDLVEAPLYIDDTAGLHLMDMHARLRRLKAEQRDSGEIGLVEGAVCLMERIVPRFELIDTSSWLSYAVTRALTEIIRLVVRPPAGQKRRGRSRSRDAD